VLGAGEFLNLAADAHAAKKCRRQRIAHSLWTVITTKNCPDLAFPRRNKAHAIGCDDGNFAGFVGVGKRSHRSDFKQQSFQSVAA
jgi:hypothetical protein